MFTVKVNFDDGYEQIVSAKDVDKRVIKTANTQSVEIHIHIDDTTSIVINNGEVYVMNENGKTVANFSTHVCLPG